MPHEHWVLRGSGNCWELIQADRNRMLEAILDKRKKKLEAQAAQAAGGSSPAAFIDLQMSDITNTLDLMNYLKGQQVNFDVFPSADLSPAQGMSLFEEKLKLSQRFIVVFGGGARDWVNHRLQEAIKLIFSNGLQTKIGIYVPPPGKPLDDVNFPAHLCQVMNNVDRFDPQAVEAFLS